MDNKITKQFCSTEYGDYITFYLDVTEQAKKIFGDVLKSAKRTLYTTQTITPQIKEEVETMAHYFENGENDWDNISEFDCIIFEFCNGKQVCFSNDQVRTSINNYIK